MPQSLPPAAPPPLVAREIYGKAISLADLTDADRALFRRSFPRFFEEPRDPSAAIRPTLAGEGKLSFETPFNLRRFSGGAHLTRGRYYSLCADAGGSSYQLLAMELLAYVGKDSGSLYDVIDLADEAMAGSRAQLTQAQAELAENRHWHVLLIHERPILITDEARREAMGHDGVVGRFHVVPYSVHALTRRRVLDLRERDAMRWLMETLWSNFPIGVFSNHRSDGVALTGKDPTGRDPIVALLADDASPTSGPPWLRESPVRLRALESLPGAFPGLAGLYGEGLRINRILEALLTPGLGGSPLDDMIAAYLQACGADGCIYPSARFDCGVRYDRERVKQSWGWNFVDYQDSPASPHADRIWSFENVERYLSLRGSLEVRSDEPDEIARGVPGWALHGLAKITRTLGAEIAWKSRLELEGEDLPLPDVLKIERLPWLGYFSGYLPRKARTFDSFIHLRLGVIAEEIDLDSIILEPVEANRCSVGTYLGNLSRVRDLWKTGMVETVSTTGLWALVQIGRSGRPVLICPYCGSVHELKPATILFCEACGFGHRARQSEEEFERVVDLIERCLDELHARRGAT